MAKTESTAVNALIEMASIKNPLEREPGDDLMFSPPAAQTPSPAQATAPARMTGPLPASKGEVQPLPRERSAFGTQTNVPPAPAAQVRTMTAPPPRGSTIPPLPRGASSSASMKMPPERPSGNSSASMKMPPLPTASRTSAPPPPTTRTMTAPPVPRTTGQHRATLPPPRPSQQMPAASQQIPTVSQQMAAVNVADGTPAPELVARPTMPSAPPPPMRQRTITPPPAMMPVAAPFEPRVEDAPAAKPSHDWFSSSRMLEGKSKKAKTESIAVATEATHNQSSTQQLARRADNATMAKKLALPAAGLVLLGICVGGFFAFDGEGGKKKSSTPPAPAVAVATTPAVAASTPTPAAQPAPAPAPKTDVAAAVTPPAPTPPTPVPTPAGEAAKPDVVAAVAPAAATPPDVTTPPPNQVATLAAATTATTTTIRTSRGEVKLVDVRIDSTPSGATVMIVDRGKTTFLGTTPISTAVDTSRSYDLVFTAANHPTQVEHLDPNATQKLAVILGKPGNAAATQVASASTSSSHRHHHHDAPVASARRDVPKTAAASGPKKGAIVDPFAADTAAEKAAQAAQSADPGGMGVLMVSAKPPCEILVDGKDTGLMTPQRAIPLAAGAHKITFVNAAQSINKTVAVKIEPDKPTKLIQDLMKK